MKNDNYKFFAAEIGAKIPTLDLHGFYPNNALDKLDIFLYQCIENKTEVARVIYGGGTGKLRSIVLEKLKDHKAVNSFKEDGGSVIVLL